MAFSSGYGLYGYMVMFFRLTNALAHFMNLMNSILFDELYVFVIIFNDDALIFSKPEEQHAEQIHIVFQRLRDHCLYAKFRKCQFWLKKVVFLGHIILENGVEIDSRKVQDMLNWAQPKTSREVQGFLDLWVITIGS